MCASVTAQYKYSYVYEGKTISFEKGEIFQLLSKANIDWWQVRRWNQGEADDIYVPANYMKEVETLQKDVNPLYENVETLLKKEHVDLGTEKKPPSGQGNQASTGNGHIPQPAPKPSPTHKKEPEYAMPNSPITKRKQPMVDAPPKSASPIRDSPIFKEWQKGYALPSSKSRSQSVEDESVMTDKKQRPPPPPVAAKSRDHVRSVDRMQKHTMEAMLNRHVRGESPSKSDAGQQGIANLGPPNVKPRPKLQRPQSYVFDASDETTTSSFSTFKAGPFGGVSSPGTPQTKGPSSQSFLPITKTPSPETIVSGGNGKDTGGGSVPKAVHVRYPIPSPVPAPSIPAPPPPAPSLPEGWKEGKTAEGKKYYYNELTRESSWTCPEAPPSPPHVTSPTDVSPMYDTVHNSPQRTKSNVYERVAPSGWTKEINTLTQTPIYTNCRTGEKWSLAKNEGGNHYYYCTGNPSMTLKDLPPVDDVPTTSPARSSSVPDTVYDHLSAAMPEAHTVPRQTRIMSESLPADSSSLDMVANPLASTFASHIDAFSSRLSNSLRKHGYLQRKKLVDSNGKKVKNDKWTSMFVLLQENQLLFYKDHKSKDQGAKPVSMFCLLNVSICSINYKEKKKLNVFQVTGPTGEQFFLQADTLGMMNDWYTVIQSAIDHTNEDCKKNPERYASLVSSIGDVNGINDSPPPHSKFSHLRKGSSGKILSEDDTEDLDILSGAEKTIRIKGRLRNLIVKRPQMEQLKKKGIIQDAIFGTRLSELAERNSSPVPKFMLLFMEHIEKKSLEVVGLYRLSGNAAMVQKLRYQVEQNVDINLDSPEWADVNIVTGCLKLFLRELPDPLIPFSSFQSFIDCTKAAPEKRLSMLAAEIDKLPRPNYHTLKALTKHLKRVVEYGHINKMQANNLGIVFGPTVMRSELDALEMATLLPLQNAVMEVMITEHEKLFKK